MNVKQAFAKEMEGRQYGPEETRDAFGWFKTGWEAAMASLVPELAAPALDEVRR